MASTYVNDLRLNELATGDGAGTWGTTTNTNFELIGEAFSYGTEAITTNADTHTTTIADGATDPGRSMYLKYTGTLDSACTITIGPNTISKMWFIENATTGSQNIIISQGSGANITIPPGDTKAVYSDGAGTGAAFFDAFASINVGALAGTSLDISGDIDVDGTTNLDIVDIDGAVNMATTALVTGVLTTTAATVFNGGFASNADSTLGTDKKVQFRDSAIYINSSADGQLDIVADTEIQIAATTIDINGAINASGEIIAASLDISGDIDVDGTTNLDVVDIDGAVDMASTALVTGVLTTTAATVFNGGFASNAASTISTADNLDTLSLISTDADANSGPNLRLYRNSSSPANNDFLGFLEFEGRNNNSQDVIYGSLAGFIDDVADGTEDGIIRLSSIVAGTLRNRMDIIPTGTVFNEDSIDLDFRVESDNLTHALFVQGSDGNVGIGTAAPASPLHVNTSGHTDLFIQSGTSHSSTISLGDSGDQDIGQIGYSNASNFMNFTTNATERLRIDSSGNLGFGMTPTTNNISKSISLVGGGSIFGYGNGTYITANSNYNGAWNTVATGVDSRMLLDGNVVFSRSTSASAGSQGTVSESMRIDTSGNVKIKTTSDYYANDLVVNCADNGGITVVGGTGDLQYLAFADGTSGDARYRGYIEYGHTADYMAFASAGTEKMRIASNGYLLVGTTSTGGLATQNTDQGVQITPEGRIFNCFAQHNDFNRQTAGEAFRFRTAATKVGSISVSTSATAYNTSSDGRLKDVTGSARGLEVINELNPVSYNWKADGKADEGLIAQEVLDIVPNAVSGSEEDMYSMDYSKLVVHLVAGMKEQQTQIEALQSEINLLKGE